MPPYIHAAALLSLPIFDVPINIFFADDATMLIRYDAISPLLTPLYAYLLFRHTPPAPLLYAIMPHAAAAICTFWFRHFAMIL